MCVGTVPNLPVLAPQQTDGLYEQEEPTAPASAPSAEAFGVGLVGMSGVGKTASIEHLACNLLVSPNEYGRLHGAASFTAEDGLEGAKLHRYADFLAAG